MTSITHSAGVIVPVTVDGYSASRSPRTLLHPILGRAGDDVTFRPAGLRKGTLTLVFATEATAHSAFGVLLTPQVFTLSDPDVDIAMSFVVAEDDVRLSLDPETRTVWLIELPFREVSP